MKRIFIIAILLSSSLFLYSQTIYYHYDEYGNRDRRSLSSLKSTATGEIGNQAEKPEFKDKVGEQDILIYPNPVENELIVNIPGLDENVYASINIFSQGGQLIYRNDKATIVNCIGFSDFSAGIYFMTIEIGGNSIQWKIVKE